MKITNPNKHARLAFVLPGQHEVRHLGPNLTEVVFDENVTIQVRAMVVPTVEHMTWIEGLMREHLPSTVKLKPVSVEPMLSEHGWPVVLAHYEILDEAGKLIEERAGAFYRIVHNNAEVMVRLRNGAHWKDRAAVIRPLILSAHVQWPHYEYDLLYTLLGFQL